MKRGLGYAVHGPAWWYYKRLKTPGVFAYRGRNYAYFYHWYNLTWTNERAVEIPIVWEAVRDRLGKKILEVGNVLSWYFPVRHTVLDKYEKGEGVINRDVLDFHPDEQYDLIVSISTLEHVGWDESPRDPRKFLRAIEMLKRLLAPGGKMIITLPLGGNPVLQRRLRGGTLPVTRTRFMKRIRRKRWEEVGPETVRAEPGGPSTQKVRIVAIAEYENK